MVSGANTKSATAGPGKCTYDEVSGKSTQVSGDNMQETSRAVHGMPRPSLQPIQPSTTAKRLRSDNSLPITTSLSLKKPMVKKVRVGGRERGREGG